MADDDEAAVGGHPGVEQAGRFQGRLDACLVRGRHVRPKAQQAPQRRPRQNRTVGRTSTWWDRREIGRSRGAFQLLDYPVTPGAGVVPAGAGGRLVGGDGALRCPGGGLDQREHVGFDRGAGGEFLGVVDGQLGAFGRRPSA